MDFKLTKKEIVALTSLSDDQRKFFNENFGKISKRLWATNLKHYVESYKILDAICLCEAHHWGEID